jgi:hypothetical protein
MLEMLEASKSREIKTYDIFLMKAAIRGEGREHGRARDKEVLGRRVMVK